MEITVTIYQVTFKKVLDLGVKRLGGSVGEASGSGHDLTVCEFEPHRGLCLQHRARRLQILCPPLSASPPCVLSRSQKRNIKKKKKGGGSETQTQVFQPQVLRPVNYTRQLSIALVVGTN